MIVNILLGNIKIEKNLVLNNLVINMMLTTCQARKILGKKYYGLSDRDIEEIIILIYNLCKQIIRKVINKNESNNLL